MEGAKWEHLGNKEGAVEEWERNWKEKNAVTNCDIHVLMREQETKESDNVHNHSLAAEKNSALIIIPSSVSRCVKTSPSPNTKR